MRVMKVKKTYESEENLWKWRKPIKLKKTYESEEN